MSGRKVTPWNYLKYYKELIKPILGVDVRGSFFLGISRSAIATESR
jgi:hypothetical protein